MKRPAFQFYPRDWQGNPKLRRCTHTEKGMWIDIMCLMHGAEEYGVLRWPLSDIAQAIGVRAADMRGLITKEVLKGADEGQACAAYVHQGYHARKPLPPVVLVAAQKGPVWYSSRMVLDEYLRHTRGIKTRFSAENNPQNDSPSRSPSHGKVKDKVNGKVLSNLSPSRSPGAWQGDGPASVLQNPPIQEEESTGTGTTHARGAA